MLKSSYAVANLRRFQYFILQVCSSYITDVTHNELESVWKEGVFA